MPGLRSAFLIVLMAVQSTAAVLAADGPAYQVADMGPNEPVRNEGGQVYPSSFQPVTDGDVFLNPAGSDSPSVWRTDGTLEGTRPVVSGTALGIGALMGSNGDLAYFWGSGPLGEISVWASDGTKSGTVLLRAGLGAPHDPEFYILPGTVLEGRLFFHDCAPLPSYRCDLWTSDGTVAGTYKLVELGGPVKLLIGSGGVGYFVATPLEESHVALWRTDGTAGGTIALRPFDNVTPRFGLGTVGGRALFASEGRLWATDGTAVKPLATLHNGESPGFNDAARDGNVLYFFSQDADKLTVWRSDGTSAGTARVLTTPVTYARTPPYLWVQRNGTRVYYLVPDLQGHEPYSLWSSDASGKGAQPVACGGCSSIPYPGWILKAADKLFFSAASGDAHSLWAIDSTQTPAALKLYCTGYCRTDGPVAVAGRAMFNVSVQGGHELWVTNGSASGTRSVASFGTLYYSYHSTNLDAVLFAASPDPGQQTTLWMSRGTPQSTVPLAAVNGNGAGPRELRRIGDRVAFLACRQPAGLWSATAHEVELIKEGYVDCGYISGFSPLVTTNHSVFFQYAEFSGQSQVWATDGTASSTRMVWDNAFDGNRAAQMAALGDDLLFWTIGPTGSSLWRSDGTATATTNALDFPAGVGTGYFATAIGGQVYFLAQSPSLQTWVTDATAAGTRRLTDAVAEFSYDPEFTRVGAFVYFAGRQGIWRTAGTAASTTLALPGPPGDLSDNDYLGWLHELNGALLYLRSENGLHTLWRSQGTPATAQQIAVLRTIGFPRGAATFGGQLYFAADDGAHGIELWRTDGTADGTGLLRDIAPGPASGRPRDLVVADGKLYFAADDGFDGGELWVSDGTAAGTRMLQDIAPDAASSGPADLTAVGDLLYFSADDAKTGRELWALPLPHPTVCTPGDGQLCLNEGRFEVEVTWRDFAGNTGHGHAVPLSGDTGYFWFFDASNVELILKVLDGRGLNGHHWVFYGALSNVEYAVTVTDTQTGDFKTYRNPSGTFASVGDTGAFPPNGALTADIAPTPPIRRADSSSSSLPTGTCVPNSARLCLQGGRFAVEAAWKDFAGNTGLGTASSITGDTGYFWFFSPSNVEVVTKVLDGRALNSKFWVFYGALSNVEYTLTVTDTQTGAQRQYHNPSGRFASVGDTSAF